MRNWINQSHTLTKLYDYFIRKGITMCTELLKFGCHGYLSIWESNIQCRGWTRWKCWCQLSIILLKRAWTHLILSITHVSHINWLPYQTPGIQNHALVFVRDVNIFTSLMDILAKSAILDNSPTKKMARSQNSCNLDISEELNFYNLG